MGERWTTALVLLQRGRIPHSPYPIQVSRGMCWFCALVSQRLRRFILQNSCVCDTLKHQNFEGLKKKVAKRGLEHRLCPALLGHFCFQHCCYLYGSVPDRDRSFWIHCCNWWFLRIAFLLAMFSYKKWRQLKSDPFLDGAGLLEDLEGRMLVGLIFFHFQCITSWHWPYPISHSKTLGYTFLALKLDAGASGVWQRIMSEKRN